MEYTNRIKNEIPWNWVISLHKYFCYIPGECWLLLVVFSFNHGIEHQLNQHWLFLEPLLVQNWLQPNHSFFVASVPNSIVHSRKKTASTCHTMGKSRHGQEWLFTQQHLLIFLLQSNFYSGWIRLDCLGHEKKEQTGIRICMQTCILCRFNE